MIIVYGGGHIPPNKREAFLELATTFVPRCRREPGCVEYSLSWDLKDTERHHLIEVWETPEAYATHLEQPHTAQFRSFMADIEEQPFEFSRYDW